MTRHLWWVGAVALLGMAVVALLPAIADSVPRLGAEPSGVIAIER